LAATTGVRLVLAKPGGHQDSAYLLELIAKQQITTLHFVPSMLQVFLEEPELKTCNVIKRVICVEAPPFDLQERFFARLDAELYNLYGPTEAAIDVTFWTCQRGSNQRCPPLVARLPTSICWISIYSLSPSEFLANYTLAVWGWLEAI